MSSLIIPTCEKDIQLKPAVFRQFRELVYQHTGIALADNKLEFVQTRLRKRLRHLKINSYRDYYDFVTENDPDGVELQQLINRVTTNKTSFFREQHHFDNLTNNVFPRLITEARQRKRPKKLRIWCAAASTGEEPYSLAMTVHDTFSTIPGWDIRILASDIDTSVLEKAQSGVYDDERVEELPQDLVKRHFFRGRGDSTDKVMVRPEIADLVTFRQINLLDGNWPIHTQFDVIFCRNVLIYFDRETHDRLMRHMSEYLLPDGVLSIGHSESLARLSDTYVRTGSTTYHLTDSAKHVSQQRSGRPQPKSQSSTSQSPKTQRSKVAASTPKTRTPAPTQQQSLPTEKPQRVSPPTSGPVQRKSIIVGEVFATDAPTQVSTVLGSCIAVCLYDDESRLGGMNHFALPAGNSCARTAASFGVHAMELLINQIMQLGGDRRRLQAKVFGGANVLGASEQCSIGERNTEFIRDFLSTESIPITAEYMGGDCGMQVLFETHTGKAKMKLLDRKTALEANARIDQAKSSPAPEPVADITLF